MNLLTYIYRTKNEGEAKITFDLKGENIKITQESEATVPFVEMVDMLNNAAKELTRSESPAVKRRAIGTVICQYITAALQSYLK